MRQREMTRATVKAALVMAGLLLAGPAFAGEDAQGRPAPRPMAGGVGVQGFGLAGLNLPMPVDSFDAVGLDARPPEVGGGARVTGLWRGLFVQAAWSRWRESGERVFVDSRGRTFPLDIGLDVEATFVDVSAGWRFGGTGRVAPFLGAGAGLATYRESSPFSEAGETVDEQVTSYHVLAGADVRLLRWLWIAGDARYRFVPGIIGDAGVSEELGEAEFNGASITARILVGF